jgi:hypothetical protein
MKAGWATGANQLAIESSIEQISYRRKTQFGNRLVGHTARLRVQGSRVCAGLIQSGAARLDQPRHGKSDFAEAPAW